MPNPKWRNKLFKKKLTDRPWSVGDNVNLSVGQGDLQANPLQLAVAYATVANGGNVITPHLAERTEDADGARDPGVQHARAAQARHRARRTATRSSTACTPAARRRAARRTACSATSRSRSRARPAPRRRAPAAPDQSWYAALAPYPNPRYVVVDHVRARRLRRRDRRARRRCKILAVLLNVKKKDACAAKVTPTAGTAAGANTE